MTNNQLLGAISQDVYRVATHYHRGSVTSAERFAKNAEELIQLTDFNLLKPKVQKILKKLPTVFHQQDTRLLADQALTYSLILRYEASK